MTTQTLTLSAFLQARIAEREAMAQVEQIPIPPTTNADGSWATVPGRPKPGDALVLAECAAHRQIVDLHTQIGTDQHRRTPQMEPGMGCIVCHWNDEFVDVYALGDCNTMRFLALIWADHPDYNPDWQPTP